MTPNYQRRGLLAAMAGVLAQPFGSVRAQAASGKPTRFIVPFGAGGTTDVVARLLAQQLGNSLGGPVVVENRPGAGGIIAIETVTKAEPDGRTMLFGSNSVTLLPLTRKNLPYDPADLQPVARVRAGPTYIAINAALPASNMQELASYARAHPGAVRYGSGGEGTILHLIGEWIKLRAHADLVHVPYKTISQAVIDASNGDLEIVLAGPTDLAPFVASGKLKIIAISGERRSTILPQIPTMVESGFPNFVTVNWNGLFVPRGVPRDTVLRLGKTIGAAASTKEFLSRGLAVDVEPGNVLYTDDFAAFMKAEDERYGQIIRDAKLKLV